VKKSTPAYLNAPTQTHTFSFSLVLSTGLTGAIDTTQGF